MRFEDLVVSLRALALVAAAGAWSVWATPACSGAETRQSPEHAKPAPKGKPAPRDGRAPKERPLPGPFKVPPHVALTEDQAAEVARIAEKLLPRLRKLEAEEDSVFAGEQKAARKAAREKAHAEGIRGKEAAELVEGAVDLSPEQRERLQRIHDRKEDLEERIRGRVRGILSEEQLGRLEGAGRGAGEPAADGKKGPGPKGAKTEKAPKQGRKQKPKPRNPARDGDEEREGKVSRREAID